MDASSLIKLSNVNKSFPNQGAKQQILKDISLQIAPGEIIAILGESGCGKSTLLNIIGGFERACSGLVLIGGQEVVKPSRRCIMLFQNYALLPWRSVLKNVEFGLQDDSLSAQEKKERAIHYLRLVGLEDQQDLFPHQLSGGMQQRVAIARALIIQPEIILMDEPFAALDAFNRYRLQDELLNIQEKEKTTIVLVTHDIDEAIYLADRVLIMRSNPGRIHKSLQVHLARPRDRSSLPFQQFRKLVFEEFNIRQPISAVGV